MTLDHDPPAASADCRCGRTLTWQHADVWAHDNGDPWKCHDGGLLKPEMEQGARLLRCPTTPVPTTDAQGRPTGTMAGCGATWIAQPDDEGDGGYTCPNCGMWFWPNDPQNFAEQPVPETCPFRPHAERRYVLIVRDVKTDLGNVIVPKGLVTVGWPNEVGPFLTVWTHNQHYARIDWASVHFADTKELS